VRQRKRVTAQSSVKRFLSTLGICVVFPVARSDLPVDSVRNEGRKRRGNTRDFGPDSVGCDPLPTRPHRPSVQFHSIYDHRVFDCTLPTSTFAVQTQHKRNTTSKLVA